MAAEETFETIDPQAQLRHALQVAKRNWFFLATMLCVGLVLGVGLFLYLPKEFESEAKLMLRNNWILEGGVEAEQRDARPISKRASLLEDHIKSTRWLTAVLDRLEWPEWSVVRDDFVKSRMFLAKLKSRLAIRMEKGETGERLVFVKFRYPDPNQARDLVAELVDYWLSQVVDSYRTDVDREVTLRMQQVEEKEAVLESARADQERFQIQSGVSRLTPMQEKETQRTLLADDLSTVEQTSIQIRAQLAKLEERLSAVGPDDELLVPRFLPSVQEIDNPDFNVRAAKLEEAMHQLQEFQARGYTEKHPDLIDARARLEFALTQMIDVPPTMTVTAEPEENPAWLNVQEDMDRLRLELIGLEAREDKLRRDLAEIEGMLQTLPPTLARLDELAMAVTTAEDAVLTARYYLQPLQDRQQALARLGTTEALPYTRLEDPEAAFKPSVTLGLIGLLVSVGLFLGIGAAWILARELLKASFSNADQVQRILRVTTLGEVGLLQTAAEARKARAQRKLQMVASVMLVGGLAAVVYVCAAHTDLLPSWLVEQASVIRDGLI